MTTVHNCPHCGTRVFATDRTCRDDGTVIGALAGSAVVAARILRGAAPILPVTLVLGCLIGLLWGAQAGRLIGREIDGAIPSRQRCPGCGKSFVP